MLLLQGCPAPILAPGLATSSRSPPPRSPSPQAQDTTWLHAVRHRRQQSRQQRGARRRVSTASGGGAAGGAAQPLLPPSALRRMTAAKDANEALDIIAEECGGRALGVEPPLPPPLSEAQCGELLLACLERGNTALALSIYRAMSSAAAALGAGSTSSAAASVSASSLDGGDAAMAMAGGGALLRWPPASVGTAAALVVGLARCLATREAIALIGSVRNRGLPTAEDVGFGYVVGCPQDRCGGGCGGGGGAGAGAARSVDVRWGRGRDIAIWHKVLPCAALTDNTASLPHRLPQQQATGCGAAAGGCQACGRLLQQVWVGGCGGWRDRWLS